MKKKQTILFYGIGMTDEFMFDVNSRDNCHEPYISLKKKCEDLGYALEVFKDHRISDCLWIIFWDVPSIGPTTMGEAITFKIKNIIKRRQFRNLYKEISEGRYSTKLALMLSEPPTSCPNNFDKAYHKNFCVIFTWKKSLVDGRKYHHVFSPVTSVYPKVDNVPFKKKKLLVDISGNKFSSHERELFTARRETIQYFEKNYPDEFDLYGTGWLANRKNMNIQNIIIKGIFDRHRYTSYRGTVRHKWEVLPKYRFAICFENIADEIDYVSQRIFDVLRCNCVPIYWGAPNIEDYVDKDAFIDRREFKTLEDMDKYLRCVSEKEYNKYINAGKAYQKSEKFLQFLSESYVDTIVRTLEIAK